MHGPHGEKRGTFRAERSNSLLSFRATAGSGITVLLRNVFEDVFASNGNVVEVGAHGTLVAWRDPSRELVVELGGRRISSNGSIPLADREASVAL